MGLTYFKRYRMEIDLVGLDWSPPALPRGYRFVGWDDSLLDAHAEAQYSSFRDEIDVNVFPCFGELAGCRRLIQEITRKEGFLPEATWLVVCDGVRTREHELCGTVQAIRDRHGMGSVQNLGITAPHRNRRVGTGLLYRSFEGFLRTGVTRVHLEVTAQNLGAVRLYRRVGFTTTKTVFKPAEVACS
ncbi:MAG TPA: GNAT family N-acetyltransferase [Thermoguttaceae bacterium]|nr:GNAT family N-acetyltransferase [Thermoguttaceae bacterium]